MSGAALQAPADMQHWRYGLQLLIGLDLNADSREPDILSEGIATKEGIYGSSTHHVQSKSRLSDELPDRIHRKYESDEVGHTESCNEIEAWSDLLNRADAGVNLEYVP